MIDAQSCLSMAQVRDGVDAVDSQLVALLAVRMTFMDAAALIKPGRNLVRDEARKAQVIANASEMAMRAGLPDGLATSLWETLVEASIAHELSVFDQLHIVAE